MHSLLDPADFELIFERMPGMCLILDSGFRILAQNDAHARATMTKREETLGRSLYEVFPDNPNDRNADGLSLLRQSLVNVLKTRRPDILPNLKFDIERPSAEGGGFEVRYWRVVNAPILDADGFVRLIINRVEDLTSVLD